MAPSPQRIITSPVRLTGSVHPNQISSLVAIDAMVRRRAALGEPPVKWELSTLAGDVAVQRAVQRAVAREGDDRDELGREGFAARARRLENEAEADLHKLLSGLRLQADLGHWGADDENATRAARVAFVRLFEAGVIRRTDAVVDSCPSCETVVDDADADVVELEVEQIRVTVPVVDGTLDLDLAEPELLVGAVAVAVPATRGLTDSSIHLPLLEADVPVVAVEGLHDAVIVVPGHDPWSYDLARQLGYPIVEVLDNEGIVRHPGPLEGLGRYAARAAAAETLALEGYVTARFEGTRSTKRCYRCGTILVPLFGRHWLLSFRDLVDPVLEEVKAGAVEFSPAIAMDRLLTVAEESGDWCISQQLWSGRPIPVATCLDCGQLKVSVEELDSCGSCMGTLQPHDDVLDARFIAAITPLVMMGWPNNPDDDEATRTILSVGRAGLDIWALPLAALGLRLFGRIPFSQLVVHQFAVGIPEPGQIPTNELVDLVDTHGARAVRAGLLIGDLDIDRAVEALEVLDSPPTGANELEALVEPYDKAVLSFDAGGAMATLVSTVREGVTASSSNRLASLVRPLLSE